MSESTSSISTDLLSHLRLLLDMALEDAISRNHFRVGINCHTSFAIPAVIIAATAIEAFVNEMFVSPSAQSFFKGSESEKFWKSVERKPLLKKIVILADKYFGRAPNLKIQPYQDLEMLIGLRNDLVHYKMRFSPPVYVSSLQVRRIAFDSADSPWIYNISSTECIRWSHNVVCETVKALGELPTPGSHPLLALTGGHDYFQSLDESVVYDYFAKMGVRPDEDA